MRAAFLVGPRQLDLRDIPDPVAPDDGLVLQVKACGICGSDLRRWREGPAQDAGDIIPGHEVAGIVVEVGENTTDYSLGDHLAIAPDVHCGKCYYCRRGLYNLCDNLRAVGITPGYPGGFAERMILTREILTNGIVHRMPKGLSFRAASLAEPCSSVIAAHQKAGTGLGDTVVVIGAGPIGCIHIEVAKARGARVIVSQRSEIRRKLAARFGPDMIINPKDEDVVARVREATDGIGADIVVVACGAKSVYPQAVEMARKGGRVILFGGLPKDDHMATFDANLIHYGEIEVVGAFSYHPVMHEVALDLLNRNIIRADLLITHTFTLDRILEAFETAASSTGLKVIITPEEANS